MYHCCVTFKIAEKKKFQKWNRRTCSIAHVTRSSHCNGFFRFLEAKTKKQLISILFLYFSKTVAHCKERWRNLRACLTRHLKQQQAAVVDGTVNHKPYYLAEHMEFLLPYTKSRSLKEQVKYETPAPEEQTKPSTSTKSVSEVTNAGTTTTYTISTSESDENQYVTLIQTSSAALAAAEALEEAQLHVEETSHIDTKPLPEQEYTTSNAKEHVQEIIYEPVAKRLKVSSQESDDADLNFFRSLLPDIRSMTPTQKRRFKREIFALIDNVFNNTDINS